MPCAMLLTLMLAVRAGSEEAAVHFQAHRGTVEEAPENTMAAFRHAWSIEGAVPEADLRTTKDGVIICLHDAMPARTTDAPEPYRSTDISDIAFDVVRTWDAGSWFDARFAGERVPTLRELFAFMQGKPERQLYLDLKGVDLEALKALIEECGVAEQVLFVHGSPVYCARLLDMFPGARTMTWLSGLPPQIKRGYHALAKSAFKGLSQLQFHLHVRPGEGPVEYMLDEAFLASAVAATRAAGVELMVRPFAFDAASVRALMDLGIHWYVADAPAKFAAAVAEARTRQTHSD